MNRKDRANNYAEARRLFEEQEQFYLDRLARAKELVNVVYRKQYLQKFTLSQFQKIEAFSIFEDMKTLRIHSISEGHSSWEYTEIQTNKFLTNKWNSPRVEINPLFIYGSDRDIAKFAREILTQEYRKQISAKLRKNIGNKSARGGMDLSTTEGVKRKIKSYQKILDDLERENKKLEKQYKSTGKHYRQKKDGLKKTQREQTSSTGTAT